METKKERYRKARKQAREGKGTFKPMEKERKL